MYPNLRLQLWRKKMRQNQLARLIPLDETVLSKIMNGFRAPAPDIRHRIAVLLECDEEWLFEIDENGPSKTPVQVIQAETA
jgi:transcriptional regulator with XRE-family HTH domain